MKGKRLIALLLSILMMFSLIPETALAAASGTETTTETSTESSSENVSTETQTDESGDLTDTTSDGEAAAAARITEMLQDASGDLQTADLIDSEYADDDVVTVIVQLTGDTVSTGVTSFLSKFTAKRKHTKIKNKIEKLVSQEDEDSSDSSTASEEDTFEVLYDYYYVMNGLAIQVEYQYLDDIQEMSGVETAFVENEYEVAETSDEEDETVEETTSYANESSLEMIGATDLEYTGKGQVIAIIDSGVDVEHEAFSGEVTDPALSESYVSGKLSSLNGSDGVYLNEKFPYAYDYADNDSDVIPGTTVDLSHGTHVAGIAAANGGSTIVGVAPDAQIVAMKVFDDSTGSGYDSNIIAAVEDAYLLGVDSINMSLGSDAGFSSSSSEVYQSIYDKVEEAGIVLNVAAGNAYSSAYQNIAGNSLAAAENPDDAMVAEPGTYSAAFTVASADNSSTSYYFEMADGTKVTYKEATLSGKTELTTLTGTYTYLDCGYGSEEEIESAMSDAGLSSLDGVIALISRGGTDASGDNLTFEAKADNAYAAGAVGMVVYNNVESTSLVDMGGITKTEFASVFISKADGEALLAAEDKTITVPSGNTQLSTTSMSDFSSWGVTPDLQLKPEITAPGGSIYSSLPGDTYGTMSGTSMATPAMAGLSAVIKEYIESDSKFSGYSESEQEDLITNLLMCTATPVTYGSDSWYSPRKQGAGLANATNVINAKAYITVSGQDDAKPKAELGDGTGPYTITFTVHNLTDEELTYTIDTCALSEEIEDGYFQQVSDNYAGNGVTITYDGVTDDNQVVVSANGEATVTVTITAEEEFAEAVAEAVNGTFLDGFVMLTASEDSGSDLSFPYLAFYGDWGSASVLEDYYADEDSTNYMQQSYVYSASNSYYYLGQNIFNSSLGINTDRYVISADSLSQIYSKLGTVTGLLRNAESLSYVITDSEGNVVKEYDYSNVKKSYYYTSAGISTYAEAFMTNPPTFDGTDEDGNEVADGTYTMTITAKVCGSDTTDSYSFDFEYDTEDPVVDSYEIVGDEGDQTLVLTLSDNHYLSAIQLVTSNSSVAKTITFDDPTYSEDGVNYYTVSVDYEDLLSKLENTSGSREDIIYVDEFDYAINYSQTEIVLQDTYPDDITLDQTEVSLIAGQNVTLSATLSPEEITKDEITWSSADTSVATVDENGKVTAVAAGETVITAQSATEGVYATCKVTVRDVTEEEGIAVSQDNATVLMGSTLQLQAMLAESLSGQTVTWESSDTDVVTVDDSGLLTGISTGSATVTASVTKGEKTWSATCAVKVQPEDYDDFEIDEDGVLTAYTGSRSDVAIPEGVTKIADYAFYMNRVVTVSIPASCTEIGNYAFEDCQKLESVTFAEGSKLTTIGTGAFLRCYYMTTCDLPDSVRTLGDSVFNCCTYLSSCTIPEGVTELPSYLFYYCSSLKEVNLPSTLTTIGYGAFDTCGIESLTIPEGVTTIGGVAFYGSSLSEISLPSTLTSIGRYGFAETKLTQITLNDGLESIGDMAFYASPLTELTIPDSVTSVGSNVVSSCSYLTTLNIGAGVQDLYQPICYDYALKTITVSEDNPYLVVGEDGALYSADYTDLVAVPYMQSDIKNDGTFTIKNTVKDISACAFVNMTDLKEIVFEDTSSVENIEYQAFAYTSLTDLSLPDSVKTLGKNSFGFCTSLSTIDLNHVETMGDYCFQYSNCAEPNFGDSLKSIGASAFIWSAVKTLNLPDSLKSIGDSAFANAYSLAEVNIGKSLSNIGTTVFTGSRVLSTITVDEDNETVDAIDNVLYADNMTRLVVYAPAKTETEYVAPDTLVSIDAFGIRNATNLESATFSEGLTTINISAFNGCTSLTELNLPDSVKTVGAFAFCSTNIETLKFGSGLQKIEEHGLSFIDTKHLVFDGGDDTSIAWSMLMGDVETIYYGDGVKEITGEQDTDTVSTIVLGSTITSISDDAFDEATDVTFYAQEGTTAYELAKEQVESLTEAGASATLKTYTPLSVSLSLAQKTVSASTKITAKATGGVGTKQYCFVSVDADGNETVLQDYSKKNSATVEIPEDSVTIKVYARDTTYYAVDATETFTIGDEISDGTYVAEATLVDAADGTTNVLTDSFAGVVKVVKSGDTYTVIPKLTDVTGVTVGGTALTADADGYYEIPVTDLSSDIAVTITTESETVDALLKISVDTLTVPADTALLDSAIEEAEALAQKDYTTTTYRVLNKALKAAKATQTDWLAEQTDVDSAYETLEEAMDGLEVKLVANRVYQTKIHLATSSDGTGTSMVNGILGNPATVTYTSDGTWLVNIRFVSGKIYGTSVSGNNVNNISYTLDGSTKDAQILYANSNLGVKTFQVEVESLSDVTALDLNYSISSSSTTSTCYLVVDDASDLTVVQYEDENSADTTALDTLYNEAVGYAEDDYTEDSYEALSKAIADAKTILTKSYVIQDEVDTVYEALKSAVDGLVACVHAPEIVRTSGSGEIFEDTVKVRITDDMKGVTIYYTTDGSEPTTESSVYDGAFKIDATTVVKAIAVKDGMENSRVASQRFVETKDLQICTGEATVASFNYLLTVNLQIYKSEIVGVTYSVPDNIDAQNAYYTLVTYNNLKSNYIGLDLAEDNSDLEVDIVSGATYSSNAFKEAAVAAMALYDPENDPTLVTEEEDTTGDDIADATDETTKEDATTDTQTVTDPTLPTSPAAVTSNASAAESSSETVEEVTTFTSGKLTYQVTGTNKVTVTGATSKKVKTLSIPSTVTYGGVTYKVTAISAKAFRGYTKLTKVTIGANVTSIGKQAFANDTKLKTVVIKGTKLTSVGKKAFKKTASKITVKAKKSVLSKYRKLLKKAGISGKATYKKA